MTLRFEPTLGVDRRDATRSGRRDGLAVDVVLDVAGGEESVDVGVGTEARSHVAVLFEVDLVPCTRVVLGTWPMATKTPVTIEHALLAGHGVAHREPRDLVVAEDLGDLACSTRNGSSRSRRRAPA